MITLEKAIAGILAITLVNGFFSTTMFTEYKKMYSGKIERLEFENSKLKSDLSYYDEYGKTQIGRLTIVTEDMQFLQ